MLGKSGGVVETTHSHREWLELTSRRAVSTTCLPTIVTAPTRTYVRPAGTQSRVRGWSFGTRWCSSITDQQSDLSSREDLAEIRTGRG
eukprot:m.83887 g.83887  ORF g.83887 m.83887 type:complete len:88 (+) comp11250_c0_seq1:1194-1457(+)